MNKIVEKAKMINEYCECIPELEVGEIVGLHAVWDGEGDIPEDSYSYKLTDKGEDLESNCPVWINYTFEVIEENENPSDIKVEITNIELL